MKGMGQDMESYQKQSLLMHNDNPTSSHISLTEYDIDYPIFRHRERKLYQSTVYNTIKLSIFLLTMASLAMNICFVIAWSEMLKTARPHKHNDEVSMDENNFKLAYSPADASIEYQLKSLSFKDPDDVYNGPPTESLDLAWSELLKPVHVRVTADELRKAGKQSIKLHDGGDDYFGYIEVYHQLHCLNRWPEKYPEVAESGAFNDGHFNHCLQVLRKGIMCNPDVTINTWTWDSVNQTKLNSITEPPRTCVNWDRFHNWALSRAIGPNYRTRLYSSAEDGWLGPEL